MNLEESLEYLEESKSIAKKQGTMGAMERIEGIDKVKKELKKGKSGLDHALLEESKLQAQYSGEILDYFTYVQEYIENGGKNFGSIAEKSKEFYNSYKTAFGNEEAIPLFVKPAINDEDFVKAVENAREVYNSNAGDISDVDQEEFLKNAR